MNPSLHSNPQRALSACELFADPVPLRPISLVTPEIDLTPYEEYVIFFSGGKDSQALALHLLECGVPAHLIEIHHHLVDGREGSTLMDWPVTASFCRSFAEAFGFRYAESWRVGGFEREMLRTNAQTAPVAVPMQDGTVIKIGGERSSCNTRRRFPQQTSNLQQRWCSSNAKIEIGSRYFTTNPRFQDGRKRLVLTGERAEESTSRAGYAKFEPHRADNRRGKRVDRWLDHWRAIHAWPEARVWDIIKRFSANPHPAYHLGLGRASCRNCVFSTPDQWATMQLIDPPGFETIGNYEREFGVTIHRTRTVYEQAARGTPLPGAYTRWREIAMSQTYTEPSILPASEWVLPIGAFGDTTGPN